MIKTNLPKGHPAEFIIKDIAAHMKKIEEERGKSFLIKVTVAHSLFQLSEAVDTLSKHGDEQEMKRGAVQAEASSQVFNAAMNNLTAEMNEEEVSALTAMVAKLAEAETAINTIMRLIDKAPPVLKEVVSDLVTQLCGALDEARQAKQGEGAPKNAH